MDRHTSASALTPPQFTPTHWAQIVATLRLSGQQANIVALILQGRRDKQIAYELRVSPATVRTHLRSIFARLDVQDRVELVLRILQSLHAPVIPSSSELINQESGMFNHNTPRQNGETFPHGSLHRKENEGPN